MKLWLVPDAVRGSKHFFKYSLCYGRPGIRLIGYDNEAGKGVHRHYKDREELYAFTTPERLIADFLMDVRALRNHERRESVTMGNMKLIVGGSIEDDSAAFLNAWHRAERGETVEDRALVFESWEALAKVLTGERYRLLKHVHSHPEPSVSALARSLGRQYRRVHADVAALEAAGLLARPEGVIHTTADTLRADIHL